MKKGKILSVISLSSLPLVTFATNGDLLIGVGAVSRSMGGIGIYFMFFVLFEFSKSDLMDLKSMFKKKA